MTATEQAIQEKELEQLVSLAEAISSKIEELKSMGSKGNKTRDLREILNLCWFGVTIFAVAICAILAIREIYYFPLNPNNSSYKVISTFGFFILSLFIVIFRLRTIQSENDKKINTKIIQEQKILGELLNMIHSYKELAYQDMSVVSRAVFEMRLNRIHFSTGENSDSAQFAETVIASIVKNTPFR